jgi:hypothetical protein
VTDLGSTTSERSPALGKLLYGDSGREIEFDDRTLAHLQVVISAKLRRHECFFFSWKDDPVVGNGRSSIWLATSIPLFFKFSSVERPPINRDWLEQLTVSSNSSQGMFLSSEPGADTPAPRSRV